MKNKRAMVLIWVMTLTMIINNMAHPVTPELLFRFNYGSTEFGIVFAAMAFTNFLISPIWGRLSDQHGRKLFMIIAPIGYAISQLGFGYSTTLWSIILFRVLAGGIASASFVAGMAYLVDVTTMKERSKYMATYTALTGFGVSLGYLLGGYIGNEDYHYTFIAQAILSVLSVLVIFFVLKESNTNKQIAIKSNFIKDFNKYRGTIIPFILIMIVLTSFIFKGFDTAFTVFQKDQLEFSPFDIGIVMAITGIIGLFTNLVVFPFLKRKYNDVKLLIFSILMIFLSLSIATFFRESNLVVTIIVLVFFFAFLAMYKPLIQAILSKVGEKNGEIMGLNNASNAVGMVLGSLYIGYTYDAFNPNFAYYSIVVIGIIVYISLLLKQKKLNPYGN